MNKQDADKRENRAITPEELKSLLEKYKIGKKPLAKLLGWGETTVLVYSEAEEIPLNEYTCKLYRLYRNSGEYYELLKKNGGRLTGVAYRKSMQAVKNLIPGSRIMASAQYIINRADGDIEIYRLEAILFCAQMISLALDDTALFEDDYQPNRSNMPYRAVEEQIERCGCFRLDTDRQDLSERECEILDFSYEMFEWYGKKAIMTFLAAERFRLCGPPGERRRRVVSKEMMKRCYKETFEQARVHKLKDVDIYMTRRMNAIKKTVNK